MSPVTLTCALLLDILVGDPHRLPHPVRVIGRSVTVLERLLYPQSRSDVTERAAGAILCVVVTTLSVLAAWGILEASARISSTALTAAEIILAYYCLAARGLATEASVVLRALRCGDIVAARCRLSMIVGRDTQALDEFGIARATVETVAENSVDGVISPLFYLALGGPIAGLAFKAVSTMDSMVGHRTDRYHRFGTCAARLDDLLNFIPARLTAFVLVPLAATMVGGNGIRALRIAVRDRLKHASPNSAHGEAAFAGALGVQLGGVATYAGEPSDTPLLNAGARLPEPADIRRAIALCYAVTLVGLCLAIGSMAVTRIVYR